MAETTTGYIAIADISGYTAFVAATEIEHSREILSELLNTTCEELMQHLVPVRIQGDAVFCVGSDDDVVPCLEAAFIAFHRRVRAMVAATTCPCNACRSVPDLTLKFVAHRGTYSTVNVRGTTDLVGADVNIAFRLLKNHVPSHEYILVTPAVLERLPELARERYVPIAEEYDLGRVEAAYRDLHDLRESARHLPAQRVTAQDADFTLAGVVNAPRDRVWSSFILPSMMQKMNGAPRVTFSDGARGTLSGAAYHCHHGRGESIFEIVDVDPPNELTLWMYGDGPEALCSYRFEPVDEGRTRVRLALRILGMSGLRRAVSVLIFRYYMGRGMRILRTEMKKPPQLAAA